MADTNDIESIRTTPKDLKHTQVIMAKEEVTENGQARPTGHWNKLMQVLEKRGDVELRGSTPVPYEDRVETAYLNIFTLWFSMSTNPLP